jgi:hypothetical protein
MPRGRSFERPFCFRSTKGQGKAHGQQTRQNQANQANQNPLPFTTNTRIGFGSFLPNSTAEICTTQLSKLISISTTRVKTKTDFLLLFNRMSPSAYLRGHGQGIFYTLAYLEHLERLGTRVINGRKAFLDRDLKSSTSITPRLAWSLPYPKARVINHPSQAISASSDLRFPIVVKANIGGSGAVLFRYDSKESLERAVISQTVDLGIDQTALVQEFVPARGGHITRVETLGGKYLYGSTSTRPEKVSICVQPISAKPPMVLS